MNYMKEVANILGVEIGDKFKIDANGFDSNYNYYFTNNGIIIDKDGYACASNDVLCALISGKYSIKRKPWKPDIDENYYAVDETGCPMCEQWYEDSIDINYYKLGNCYRTKQEAEANS